MFDISIELSTLKIRYSLFFKNLRIFLFSIGNILATNHMFFASITKTLNFSSTPIPNTGAWVLESGFSIGTGG